MSPLSFYLPPVHSHALSLLLLHPQADVNKGTGKDGSGPTPLYSAAEKGSTEIAALLIEAKVRSVCVGGEVKQ